MAFLILIIKSAFRNRLRATLTAVGVAVAIIAFLFLRTFISAYYSGVEASAADRLVVRNKISIIFPLPLSYLEKVKNVPGVTDIMHSSWFGGIYQDEKNFFAQFAVDPEAALRVYPEIELTPEEKQAFLADRTGCIIGIELSHKYGFKIGDQIPLKGAIYPGDWKMTVRGIYTSKNTSIDLSTMYFHWKYLDDSVPEARKNQVGLLIIRVADASQSTQVASTIDKMFVNSPAETRTESEKQFNLSFISMLSQIIRAIWVVSIVILIILMLILGNTLAMATRERSTEYAVMRAIGFSPRQVVLMVIGEGFTIGATGAILGVGLAIPTLHVAFNLLQKSLGFIFGPLNISWLEVFLAGGIAVLAGMLASAIPAWRTGRLRIVDALRRVE